MGNRARLDLLGMMGNGTGLDLLGAGHGQIVLKCSCLGALK